MSREYINPPELAPPPVGLYNHVVKVGSTVYISGQVPRGLDGKAMHPGDAAAQIRQVWTNLEIAMKAAGGALSDIVKTTTYVVGAENLPKIREARMSILPEQGRPTSTTVVVAGLADPDFLVEVEAVAELDG
jgi:enamine deaminase RidA (YjgF/YER057c/UK114 family)